MQKRKLFITLAAIITISLIGLAGQCGIAPEAPTIKLEIYDGPDYSAFDDMCYYRIEATVSDSTDTEVTFADDDNVKPLSLGRVEVGVKAGESYTLIATATNPQGNASASITLLGECGKESMGANTDADGDANADINEKGDGDADADGDTDTDGDGDGDTDVDIEAPTISLAIYEGPALEGSICYYRVEATVTGGPTVSFSKDDSSGAFGSKKAQVNLNNPTDTYTLTATATNSEGSATDSITLSWGCATPTPDPIEKNVDISADTSLSGFITVDFGAYPGNDAYVGDNGIVNKPIRAYLSFDIDDLGDIDGITIKDISVSIPIKSVSGQPEQVIGSEIQIKVYDYGNSLDYPADQAATGVLVKTLPNLLSLTNFDFSTNVLKDELQKAVDVDKKWFQLTIGLSKISVNNISDYYKFVASDATLHIEYEIPG